MSKKPTAGAGPFFVVHTSATNLGPDGLKLVIGERYAADHPLVKAYPGYFVAADEVGEAPSSTELDLIAGRGEKPRQSQVVPLPGGSFEVEALE